MSKQTECQLPITIGEIRITPELINALSDFSSLYGITEAKNIIAENCLYLTGLQNTCDDVQQIDSDFYHMLNIVYRVLKALGGEVKGGVK